MNGSFRGLVQFYDFKYFKEKMFYIQKCVLCAVTQTCHNVTIAGTM
jgi:hypothetical protein